MYCHENYMFMRTKTKCTTYLLDWKIVHSLSVKTISKFVDFMVDFFSVTQPSSLSLGFFDCHLTLHSTFLATQISFSHFFVRNVKKYTMNMNL